MRPHRGWRVKRPLSAKASCMPDYDGQQLFVQTFYLASLLQLCSLIPDLSDPNDDVPSA